MKYIVPFLFALVLVSCDDDDDSDSSNNPSNNSPNGVVMDLQGVNEFLQHPDGLFISLLIDDNEDETNHFEAYTFQFDDQGTVTATSPDDQRVGTYLVFEDDNRIELSMNFSSTDPFDDLDDDWYYIDTVDNTIRFEDDQDPEINKIEFTKN
jgi:hypothetical protein